MAAALDPQQLIQLPVMGALLRRAVSDGIRWADRLMAEAADPSDRQQLCDRVITNSALRTAGWSTIAGLGGPLTLLAGLSFDAGQTLYGQVRLAAALFRIHGVELDDRRHLPLLMAAAAGIGVAELAALIGSQLMRNAIHQVLGQLSKAAMEQTLTTLGSRLLARAAASSVSSLIPVAGAIASGDVSAALMVASGRNIRNFLSDYASLQMVTVEVIES